jgi:hypothetical protein
MPVDLQAIFQRYGDLYAETHGLFSEQLQAMRAIQRCRTAALGGHIDACDACGVLRISYNSCRNRHCPQCQTLRQLRWVAARAAELLQHVGYFHVVFTLPEALNPIALQNPRVVYGLLFRAAAESLAELAADPKYLGARIGMTAVLHTWGQTLAYHPHIHGIVPGGGLTPDGRWQPARKDFFLPVKVLSRKFRGKFLAFLQDAALEFSGSVASLSDPAAWAAWLTELYTQEWVVYCKPPFADASRVLAYLGRYTHRVAISNARILRLENDEVTFRWRDYRDGNQQKEMTVSVEEFIRRFLLHVLPSGFTRIRHYGFLSPRNKSTQLKACQRLTQTIPPAILVRSDIDLLSQLLGRDVTLCPVCGVGRFQRTRASPEEQYSA